MKVCWQKKDFMQNYITVSSRIKKGGTRCIRQMELVMRQ